MLNQNKNIILVIIFFIILLSISSALIIEYVLGHQPCKLCLYERIPYFISVFLIFIIFFLKKYEKIIFFLLFLTFMFSAFFAFYHLGIEQGFISESFMCNLDNGLTTLSKEELLKELNQKMPSCKDVTFKILGLSLAALNTILSILLSIIFLKFFLNYGSNSTSQYK